MAYNSLADLLQLNPRLQPDPLMAVQDPMNYAPADYGPQEIPTAPVAVAPDPVSALHTLLGGKPQPQPTAESFMEPGTTSDLPSPETTILHSSPTGGEDRNEATSSALAKKLGLGSDAFSTVKRAPLGGGESSGVAGIYSQNDLQKASDTQDQSALADAAAAHKQATALALSPEDQQLADIASKRKINENQAGPNATHHNDLEMQRLKNEAAKYSADQSLAGKNAQAAAKATADSSKFPAQIQSQAINAGATADHLDILDREISDPDLQPYIGALQGRWSDFMQGKIGANDLGVSDPATMEKVGRLRMDLTLAASGVARAHNQRGATKELLEQFEKELNSARSPELIHGAIAGAKTMMNVYAHPLPFTPGVAAGATPLGSTLGLPAPATAVPGAAPASPLGVLPAGVKVRRLD